ncbi:MAG: hypothetical protein EOO75_10660, partial [Myxococcales bacterium]
MSSPEAASLDAAIAAIDLAGNLLDAERVRLLPIRHGALAAPFLSHAVAAGTPAIRGVALEGLALVDPSAGATLAFARLAAADEPVEVREGAVRALGHVPGPRALSALLEARRGSPLVAAAARAMLEQRDDLETTRLLRELVIRSLDDETGDPEEQARRTREGLGLLPLVVRRSPDRLEGKLLSWWRTHPSPAVQYAAAEHLTGRPENARALLDEGLPQADLDDPQSEHLDLFTRHVLAGAITTLLRGDPARAFETLSPYLDPRETRTWYGLRRAERIVDLLVTGLGLDASTRHGVRVQVLHQSRMLPDPRWRQ